MQEASFKYNPKTGKGTLFFATEDQGISILARTGSIDKTGTLVNAIPIGIWLLKTPHERTTEQAMLVDGLSESWKIRLYTEFGARTSYLIHPDGGKPGSMGCIVFNGINLDIRNLIDNTLAEESPIKLIVSTEGVV